MCSFTGSSHMDGWMMHEYLWMTKWIVHSLCLFVSVYRRGELGGQQDGLYRTKRASARNRSVHSAEISWQQNRLLKGQMCSTAKQLSEPKTIRYGGCTVQSDSHYCKINNERMIRTYQVVLYAERKTHFLNHYFCFIFQDIYIYIKKYSIKSEYLLWYKRK